MYVIIRNAIKRWNPKQSPIQQVFLAMIGSMMVVTGQWKKPGVFNVEEFDPDPYMEALNKWGLPWKVCEDPELVKVWKANED